MPPTKVGGVDVLKKVREKRIKNMARKRVVSRTIVTTKATAMVCMVSTAEVLTKEYTLSLKLNEADALKAAKKVYETDNEKIVAITKVEYNEQLYAMPEIDFLKYATPVNADEVEDDDEEPDEVPEEKQNTRKKK